MEGDDPNTAAGTPWGTEAASLLLALEDRLRPIAEPMGMPEAAVALLGTALAADRALWLEADAGGDLRPSASWPVRAIPATPLPDLARLDRGQTVVEPDGADGSAPATAFRLAAPVLRDGRPVAALLLARPRAWTAAEVALAESAAGRTWAAVERARAERRLREGEARVRQLAESIREVFYIVELDDRRMSYVSPAFEEVWGRPVAEVYAASRRFLDAVHPADRARVEADTARLWGGEPVEGEYRILRPDGSVRHIFDRAALVSDPVTGRRRAVGLAADVMDRRRAEERLQLATEAAGIGIFDAGLVTGASEWDLRQREI